MTKLAILTPKEQRSFDLPPKFKKADRSKYFSVSPKIKQLAFNKLRKPVNRVGFILQLGYFRASGKFFVSEEYNKRDIQYVCKMLNIHKRSINIEHYSETSRKNHRDTILGLAGWILPNDLHNEKLTEQAKWYIEQQISPQKVFSGLVEFCWNNKLVIPSYSKLSAYITDYYNFYEKQFQAQIRSLRILLIRLSKWSLKHR